MISIDCHHPDLEEFIDVKNDLNKVTKANISVRFTNDFLEAVEKNQEIELCFDRPESNEHITKIINARDIFYRLAENNWRMAEPGCLFWDTISNYNLLQYFNDFKYAGTNPCAEEPLPAGGSCLLGSINLAEFVQDGVFNKEDFVNTVKIAVRALNEVMKEGQNLHPLEEQKQCVDDWRQIGLGIMGLADMLIKLGIKYGSTESLDICDEIGFIMAKTAIEESHNLAELYEEFPKCKINLIKKSDFYRNHVPCYNWEVGLANSQLLTIAPTGTLSTMLGISGGIEPIFANYYTRKTQSLHGEEKEYKIYTPIVQEYMTKHNCTEDELPEYFITAPEIPYKNRIDMQSVWQSHIDASISSTVNLPNETSIDDVYNLYLYAWKQGLKGITIFREGCDREGILTTKEKKEKPVISYDFERGEIIPLSDEIQGEIRNLTTGCGTIHCQLWSNEDQEPVETYFLKGSGGGCERNLDGLSRVTSLALRGGIPAEAIIDQLKSVSACTSFTKSSKKTSKGTSCPSAIGFALEDMTKELKSLNKISTFRIVEEKEEETESYDICPDCGEKIPHRSRCNTCPFCGWNGCDK